MTGEYTYLRLIGPHIQYPGDEIFTLRYDEDGALFNFIRDTETNSSCPCVETQARLDLGRFMPHPRCSQVCGPPILP